MRTPGRCTNLEGCWISASQRDVWLSLGEEFVCPNCGNALTAPPRTALAARSMRKAVVAGASATVAIAACALLALNVPATSSAPHTRVLAARAPSDQVAVSHLAPASSGRDVAAMAPGMEQLASARLAPAPQTKQGAVLLYAAKPLTIPAPTHTSKVPAGETLAADMPAVAPVIAEITMVSQASFVLPKQAQRPVVLPISFGRPVAPEDDAQPVSLRWRHHGMTSIRRTTFLPAAGNTETVTRICETPALLR